MRAVGKQVLRVSYRIYSVAKMITTKKIRSSIFQGSENLQNFVVFSALSATQL
jgi:hypothetical protein